MANYTRNNVIKIFRKEGPFMEQKYRKTEDQKSGPKLACNLDYAIGKGLELKVKNFSKIV